jgi:hypothetical protein
MLKPSEGEGTTIRNRPAHGRIERGSMVLSAHSRRRALGKRWA